MNIMSTKALKCVVVGDDSVGKTCLLVRSTKNEFSYIYIPTILDNYFVKVSVADEDYDLQLFDTAGQDEYDEVRKFTLRNADLFLVCFSVDLPSSFVNVTEKWIPELQKHSPGTPFILVGTKTDLRDDQKTIEKLSAMEKSPITEQEGEKLANELNAIKYIECSALTKNNLEDFFREITIAVSNYRASSSNNVLMSKGITAYNRCVTVTNSVYRFCSQNCTIL